MCVRVGLMSVLFIICTSLKKGPQFVLHLPAAAVHNSLSCCTALKIALENRGGKHAPPLLFCQCQLFGAVTGIGWVG